MRWRYVVIADLLALEQRLLKAVSPNTLLLDTLGVMMVKSPHRRPLIPPGQERVVLEHRYQSLQRSSPTSP